jgi:hypothetical protein
MCLPFQCKVDKKEAIITGAFLLSIIITGSSLAFAQQPSTLSVNRTANNMSSSNVFYKGPSVLGIRVYDYFKNEQWQVVENYISQGYEIKSVIPASQLPNTGSPMGILVILEKR